MGNRTKWKILSKKMMPKILKASLSAIVLYFLLFYVPTLIMSGFIPSEYELFIDAFAAMVIFFVVITQLASGTIFQYMFGTARALAFMIFFIQVLYSGITTSFGAISIFVDLRMFFAMLIAIELLEFAKNLLETINFISATVTL